MVKVAALGSQTSLRGARCQQRRTSGPGRSEQRALWRTRATAQVHKRTIERQRLPWPAQNSAAASNAAPCRTCPWTSLSAMQMLRARSLFTNATTLRAAGGQRGAPQLERGSVGRGAQCGQATRPRGAGCRSAPARAIVATIGRRRERGARAPFRVEHIVLLPRAELLFDLLVRQRRVRVVFLRERRAVSDNALGYGEAYARQCARSTQPSARRGRSKRRAMNGRRLNIGQGGARVSALRFARGGKLRARSRFARTARRQRGAGHGRARGGALP